MNHEKKSFEDLLKISLFYPVLSHKRGQPFYVKKIWIPVPKHVSYQMWLKLPSGSWEEVV